MRINLENFEVETRKKEPYYREDKKNGVSETHQYAVCPACDNPISIIGLYSLPPGIKAPYGRHHPSSIPKLAEYNQEAYDFCPYASRKWTLTKASKRKGFDKRAEDTIQLLRDNFDHVVKIIRQDTGILISKILARKMLQAYRSERGYLYSGATLINIPWIFAYMSDSQSVFGQNIQDTDMKSAILQKVPGAAFKEGRLVNEGRHFFQLNLYFINHSPATEEGKDETMILSLSSSDDAPPVYQKTITIKPNLFYGRINSRKKWRDEELLNIAKEVLI